MNGPTYHLKDPTKFDGAACANARAGEMLTHWRRFVTCTLCLAITAPRAHEKSKSTVMAVAKDGPPIRMTALARHIRASGEEGSEAAARELEREAKIAGSFCDRCNRAVDDPVVRIDAAQRRAFYGCPFCAGDQIRARWEREGAS